MAPSDDKALWKPALLKLKPFGADYDRDFPVESRTSSAVYQVNLHRLTCTCPDFLQRRSVYPTDNLGRICKHLKEAVLDLDLDAFGDELTRVIFKSPFGPYDRLWFAPGPRGDIVALGMVDDKPWINLFVRIASDGPYSRFGYHPEEERWAYDSAPPDAEALVAMIGRRP